jgi:hypothetical protein
MKRFLILTCALVCLVAGAFAQQQQQRKTIAALTEKAQRIDGFVPLYINSEEGKIFLEVPRFDREMLYLVSLPTGVGSNPIGLDRAQLGTTKVVKFERAGNSCSRTTITALRGTLSRRSRLRNRSLDR